MRIVLLGPPGSGKGNLSRRLGEHCNIPVVSCTSVLERTAAGESELGRLAKEAMDCNRVSDELLLALLRVRLAHKELARGFVLVDFPRNASQADVVDGILDSLGRPLDLIFYVSVDSDQLMERLVGRIACEQCGAKYNLYINPPLVEGVCDYCGARVNRRPGDYEETISNRLRIYDGLMSPLLQYYGLHGKLRRVSGDGPESETWAAIRNIVDGTPRTVIESEPVSEPASRIENKPQELTEPKRPDKRKMGRTRVSAPAVVEQAEANIGAKAAIDQAVMPGKANKHVAVKKTRAKKAAAKKTDADSGPVNQVRATNAVAKKAAAKKAAVGTRAAPKKQAAVKKTVAKKTVANKTVGNKAGAKKVSAKRVVTKSATSGKQVAKKVSANKTTTTAATGKKVARKAVAKPTAKKKVAVATKKARVKKTRKK